MTTIGKKTTSIALAALLSFALVPISAAATTSQAWGDETQEESIEAYSFANEPQNIEFGSRGSKTFFGESTIETQDFTFTVPSDMEVEFKMNLWAVSCTHGRFSVSLIDSAGETDDIAFQLGAFDTTPYNVSRSLKAGDYRLRVTFWQSHRDHMGTFGVWIGEKKATPPTTKPPTENKKKPSSGFSYEQKSIKVPWSGGFSNNYLNRSGGALTDESSNHKIATFDDEGYVVFKGIGRVTITTTQAETSQYAQSSASFVLTIVPDKPTLKSLTPGKKSLVVKWQKQAKKFSSGYEIRYSTNKSMKNAKTKVVKGASKSSVKLTKLKSGKKYYVQVRVYKTVSGKNYYSSWSSKKAAKVK